MALGPKQSALGSPVVPEVKAGAFLMVAFGLALVLTEVIRLGWGPEAFAGTLKGIWRRYHLN